MEEDQLRKWAWRAGLLLMVAAPIIYVLGTLTSYVFRDGSNPLSQVVMFAYALLPSIFLSVGAGAIVCLLVRIETHLAALRTKD